MHETPKAEEINLQSTESIYIFESDSDVRRKIT